MDTLDGVLVVELATGIAGPYASKLFADAGADVVKVEPLDGDEERRRPIGAAVESQPLAGGDAPLFRHLNTAKRSILGCVGDRVVDALLERADLVIDSSVPALLDIDAWRRRRPSLVVLSLTPFGRRGPWQDRPATGFTVQAASGSIGSRGRTDQVPFQAGGRLAEWAAGVAGAVGALAAVMRARATGTGEHVDCSLLATDHLITNGNMCVRHSLLGHPVPSGPARIIDVPSIERTADGYIGFNTNTRQQYESFVTMIGRIDVLDDPRWASADFRLHHADAWNELVHPWMREHTTMEIMRRATELRIPVAPVNNGESLLEQEQFRARGALGPYPDGGFIHPKPPYRIDGERPQIARRAPRLGEDATAVAALVEGAPPMVAETGHGTSSLPFAGVRVLDATSMWAGPLVGQVLAALGADVIHLESIQRLDLGRLKVDGPDVDEWWERGHNWLMINWNKRDLTIDLTRERGRALVETLLPTCDVFVENFAPRVFERFGFTAERVRELNPEVVYARMPAFGLDGPWREFIGFAQTMEQMSGLAWLTGHEDDESPSVPRGPCDPLAGYHALYAILVALWRRRAGLGGSVVEAAMAESALNAAAESVVGYSAEGVVLGRRGNRGPDAAPQGLYQCRGNEQWLALSVENDNQWRALQQVLGRPAWAEDAKFATAAGRHHHHDRLDSEIGAWAAGCRVDDAVERLIAVGVPAAAVTDPRFADLHPQLNAVGYFEEVDHELVGRHRLPTLPFRYASVDRWVRAPAPRLGQHNDDILGGILGLDEAERASLASAGIIGRRPLAGNPRFDL